MKNLFIELLLKFVNTKQNETNKAIDMGAYGFIKFV